LEILETNLVKIPVDPNQEPKAIEAEEDGYGRLAGARYNIKQS
jgi:hypothetical protein